MLNIGYVRSQDDDAHEDAARLRSYGCQVVRTEAAQAQEALASILDFIGAGDQLVVTRLDRLAGRSRDLLDTLDRLDAVGAALRVLSPDLSSAGLGGVALRAALQAVASLEPPPRRRSPAAAAQEIHALQQAGVGPVEIARRLGVSRMTVWRKLKATEGAAQA